MEARVLRQKVSDRLFALSLRLIWPEAPRLVRYGFAIGLTLAVAVLKLAVPEFGIQGPDLFLTIPVAASAILAGLGPALVATIGATMVAAYFSPPAFLFGDSGTTAADVVGFFAEGVVIAILGAGLRSALSRTLQTVRRLEELQRERAALFAAVNHELLNPLAVLSAHLQLAVRYAGDDAVRDRLPTSLERARVQVARLIRLAEDLLVISTTTDVAFRVALEPLDLVAAADAAALRASTLDESRQVQSPAAAAPVIVSADGARLDQILDNLLKNALSYSPPGSPVEISVTQADDRRVGVVRVRDRGRGIPVGERDRVFGRFERGSRAGKVAGSGLGLYLSRELAMRMGGSLVLEESSDAGSVFALELPLGVTGNPIPELEGTIV